MRTREESLCDVVLRVNCLTAGYLSLPREAGSQQSNFVLLAVLVSFGFAQRFPVCCSGSLLGGHGMHLGQGNVPLIIFRSWNMPAFVAKCHYTPRCLSYATSRLIGGEPGLTPLWTTTGNAA